MEVGDDRRQRGRDDWSMKDCSASRHELLPTQQAWQQSEPGQDCWTETVKPGLAQFDLSMNGCAQPGVGMSVRGWWFRSRRRRRTDAILGLSHYAPPAAPRPARARWYMTR
jgi:hypothetical protein